MTDLDFVKLVSHLHRIMDIIRNGDVDQEALRTFKDMAEELAAVCESHIIEDEDN